MGLRKLVSPCFRSLLKGSDSPVRAALVGAGPGHGPEV